MKTLFAIFTVLLTCFHASAQKIDAVIKSKPKRLVNDYVQVLSIDEKQKLERSLIEFNKNTSTQIAIVLIKTLDGRKIEEASLELFNTWGIGQTDKNNGVLILAAMNDRQVRIEVGRGLEAAIPNEVAARIISYDIVPDFKETRYYDGLNKATISLMKFALQAFPDTTSNKNNALTAASAHNALQEKGPAPPAYDYAAQNTYVSETNSGLSAGIRVAIAFVVLIFLIAIVSAIVKNRKSGSMYSSSGYRRYNSTATRSAGGSVFGGLFAGWLLSEWFSNSQKTDENNSNDSGNYSSGGSDFGGFDGGSTAGDSGGGGSSGGW